MALLDEARALLGPPRRRLAPEGEDLAAHLRPRRGRRSPGPVPDAAADGRPALSVRLDDGGRRHRPVHRDMGAGVVVAGRRTPPGPPGLAAGRADRQLPHTKRDHGDGRPDPRAGGAGHASPRSGAHDRASAADHPGRGAGRVDAWRGAGRADGRVGTRRAGRLRRTGWSGHGGGDRSAHLLDPVASALDDAGLRFGRVGDGALDEQVTLLAIEDAKGLEFDSVMVVEPARIVRETARPAGPLRRLHPGHPAVVHRSRRGAPAAGGGGRPERPDPSIACPADPG